MPTADGVPECASLVRLGQLAGFTVSDCGAPPPPPNDPNVLLSKVQYGMTTPEIQMIQVKLFNLGFYNGAQDGFYGPATRAGYAAWEESVPMAVVDGIAGCVSLGLLGEANAAVIFTVSCDIPDPVAPPDEPPPPPPGTTLKLSDVQYGLTNSSVTMAQQKLINLGFSIPAGATGFFGDQTKAAWQAFEGSIGVTQNGVPDCTSLTQLGNTAVQPSWSTNCDATPPPPPPSSGEPAHDYSRISYSGVTLNRRTKVLLDRAVAALTAYAWSPVLIQGSYNPGGVSGSAGTHDGGGAMDISTNSMTTNGADLCVQALRRVGFAAWRRTSAEGFSPHIHAVAIGDQEMHYTAADQVQDYFNGRNGLANNGPDTLSSSYKSPSPMWPSWCNQYNF